MSNWHCHASGKQYGPIAEDVLRSWIAQHRVTASDLVWSEGMAEWAAAQSVFPDAFAAGAGGPAGPPGPPPLLRMVAPPAPGGTGGQTPNGQLTTQARGILRGKWGLPIAFSLLLALLNGVASQIPAGTLILGGPLALGGVIFYLTFARGGKGRIEMLFDGFQNFVNALVAFLLIFVFVLLWSLLLIVPGIIASLGYSQTFYLMADDKSLTGTAAMRRSKELMRGRKWKLFCLHVRFFGWSLLCILTLGIGFLWLWPYEGTTFARFYDDLKPPAVG